MGLLSDLAVDVVYTSPEVHRAWSLSIQLVLLQHLSVSGELTEGSESERSDEVTVSSLVTVLLC